MEYKKFYTYKEKQKEIRKLIFGMFQFLVIYLLQQQLTTILRNAIIKGSFSKNIAPDTIANFSKVKK